MERAPVTSHDMKGPSPAQSPDQDLDAPPQLSDAPPLWWDARAAHAPARDRRRLTAEARSLGELFFESRRYGVPNYQRPYGWSDAEALTLLDDVRAAHAVAAERRDAPAPYFLGALVAANAVRGARWSVIDGQQRLITLTILLAVLRDLDADGEDRLGPFILPLGAETAGPHHAIVNTRPRDLAFFFENIQTPGAVLRLSEQSQTENDAQTAMLAVALAYRNALTGWSAGARRWFAEYLLRCCSMVEVLAPTEDEAHTIFMVLNARGRDLRDNDLLKAETLGAVRPAERARCAEKWEALEADLGEQAFAELFRHVRTIHAPGRSRRTVAADIREALKPAEAPEAFIDTVLSPMGRVMSDLLSGVVIRTGAPGATTDASVESALGEDGAAALRSLRRVLARDWLAPAIAFFALGRRRADEAADFLVALERQAYGLLLQGAPEASRRARYARVIEAIRDRAETDAIVETLYLTDNDKKMARIVLSGAIYQKESLRRAVLLRLDERLADAGARYDREQVTVEHVMPRNPPPDSAWTEAVPDPKERRYWVDRLGNLALLSRRANERVANHDFERKKRGCFSSVEGVTTFAITSQILHEPVWNAEVMARRQKMLFELACEIWRL